MSNDNLIYINPKINRQKLEDRLTRLRYNWAVIPTASTELIPYIQKALDANQLQKAYVLCVLAESYIIAP